MSLKNIYFGCMLNLVISPPKKNMSLKLKLKKE